MRHRISIAGMTPKALDSRFRGNDGHKQKHGILAFAGMTGTSKAHWIPAFARMTSTSKAHWIPAFAGMTGTSKNTGFLLSRE